MESFFTALSMAKEVKFHKNYEEVEVYSARKRKP
jgi:hypothetical protein